MRYLIGLFKKADICAIDGTYFIERGVASNVIQVSHKILEQPEHTQGISLSCLTIRILIIHT